MCQKAFLFSLLFNPSNYSNIESHFKVLGTLFRTHFQSNVCRGKPCANNQKWSVSAWGILCL